MRNAGSNSTFTRLRHFWCGDSHVNDPNVLHRAGSGPISKHDRQMECGDQFRGRDQALVALRRSRTRQRHVPAGRSNVEPVGARETFGSEVDARRPKLSDVFGRGGISAGQRRPRPGNIDVQGKIRNAGLDWRRGGIRSACRRQALETRHV